MLLKSRRTRGEKQVVSPLHKLSQRRTPHMYCVQILPTYTFREHSFATDIQEKPVGREVMGSWHSYTELTRLKPVKVLDKCKTKAEQFVCHAVKAYRGCRGITSRILNLGARCKRMISFTLRPIYSPEKESSVPIT